MLPDMTQQKGPYLTASYLVHPVTNGLTLRQRRPVVPHSSTSPSVLIPRIPGGLSTSSPSERE